MKKLQPILLMKTILNSCKHPLKIFIGPILTIRIRQSTKYYPVFLIQTKRFQGVCCHRSWPCWPGFFIFIFVIFLLFLSIFKF